MYIHSESVHNLQSPEQIVNCLYPILKPESVLDVGCGIGTFLHCFKNAGVRDILGVDGDWVDQNLLTKYIKSDEFKRHDLTQPLNLGRKYDLVVCLEVAEHLPENRADTLVSNLVLHGDIILFSAAIPGQQGQNHFNEKWPQYWADKFENNGFEFIDVVRPLLWQEKDILFWYKQNSFLVVRKGTNLDLSEFQRKSKEMLDLVHPDLFNLYLDEYLLLLNGKKPLKVYFHLIWKALFDRFKRGGSSGLSK